MTRPPGLDTLIEGARLDLARRLGRAVEQIEVVEARFVTWPDSSAGCPSPGMEYLQVLTDGALIRLRSAGIVYAYHSAAGSPPALCERPADTVPAPPRAPTE